MPPTRLVRRRPLSERIASLFDPADFFLWLSVEVETRDLGSKSFGTKAGLALSSLFLLARANVGPSRDSDDVFGDGGGSGWLALMVYPIVWLLVLFSIINASYVIMRVRQYRLFEANIELQPQTPSAKRVRIQSAPVASSPLRFLADMITSESAESRAHPDQKRDTWELSVWDPLPASLRIFCLFGPGHVFVYLAFLPIAALDEQPSVTVFKCLALQVILSSQLLLLQAKFSQQVKDTAVIHREVLHEYDAKYVHPRLYPVVRDAATQIDTVFGDDKEPHVKLTTRTGTPTTLLRRGRGFQGYASPLTSKQSDSDSSLSNVMSPRLFTPPTSTGHSEMYVESDKLRSPAHRQSLPASNTPAPQRGSTTTATGGFNFGGNLGVYSHSNSPLKKATSMGEMNSQVAFSPRNSREMAAIEQREKERSSSPIKNQENRRLTTGSSNPFANPRPSKPQYERYPSRYY